MAETNIIEKAEKEIKYIFETIDSINIDDIQTKGVTLRAGNKVLKLQVISDNPVSIEDEIREEFRKKLNEQLGSIKGVVNDKISEMSVFVSNIKSEFDRNEKELKDKMDRARPMPDIEYKHGKQGLSIVKGESRDVISWLVQGVYAPKTVDFKILDKKFVRKLITPVIFQIDTKGSHVSRVSTRMPINLEYFQHYHQSDPDCWGKYKPASSWKTPEDIIRIAREAEAVLENINSISIAKYDPNGLPRFDSVKRHIIDSADKKETNVIRNELKRTGITENMREEDIWMTTDTQ